MAVNELAGCVAVHERFRSLSDINAPFAFSLQGSRASGIISEVLGVLPSGGLLMGSLVARDDN